MFWLTVIFWASWAFVIYSYVVFPLLLALCARMFAPAKPNAAASQGSGSHQADEHLPRVAMVIAAFNEEKVICAKLANTWAIDYPADRFQLVIGSDGSFDGTAEILEECTDNRLKAFLFKERRGKISVLNDVMSQVDADIVVMSDANTMYAPDAIRKLVRHFVDPKVGCVSGELKLEQNGGVSGEGLYWKYEQWIKGNESRLGFLIGCNGAVFAIRPELFQPLPQNTVVEDFVLTMRVIEQGRKVLFDPEARVVEPPCATAYAEMVRKIRIGAGGFQALGLTKALLHPRFGMAAFAFWGHKVIRWMVPQFLLVALAANVALASHPFFGALLAVQLGGIGIAAWAYNVRGAKALPKWTRPVSYFYLMNYALFCGFLRFLFKTQRVTWERASFAVSAEATSAAQDAVASSPEPVAEAAPAFRPTLEEVDEVVEALSPGAEMPAFEVREAVAR